MWEPLRSRLVVAFPPPGEPDINKATWCGWCRAPLQAGQGVPMTNRGRYCSIEHAEERAWSDAIR